MVGAMGADIHAGAWHAAACDSSARARGRSLLKAELMDSLALGGELPQEGGNRKAPAQLRRVLFELWHAGVQPDRIGVVHRPASISRPAVTVDPDDIDVRSAHDDALFEYLRALVDHRIQTTFEDFLCGKCAGGATGLPHEVANDFLGVRRGPRIAVLVVVVVPGSGLLSTSVHFTEHLADRGALGCLLVPAQVQAG